MEKSLPHISGSAYVFCFFILLFFPSWASEITHSFGKRLKPPTFLGNKIAHSFGERLKSLAEFFPKTRPPVRFLLPQRGILIPRDIKFSINLHPDEEIQRGISMPRTIQKRPDVHSHSIVPGGLLVMS